MTFPHPLDPVLSHRRQPAAPPPACAAPSGDTASFASWQRFANPATSQGAEGTCGGQAAANALEIMLRRDAPEEWLHDAIGARLGHLRWQLDARRMYLEARRYFHADADLQAGLFQDEISAIPLLTGILGPVRTHRIPRGWANRHRALLAGPFVAGLGVTRDWERTEESGYIDGRSQAVVGGHELCFTAGYCQGGSWFDVPLNSWGADWGRYGCALLNGEYTDWALLDDATQWQPEDPEWYLRSAWQDYVVESPVTSSA